MKLCQTSLMIFNDLIFRSNRRVVLSKYHLTISQIMIEMEIHSMKENLYVIGLWFGLLRNGKLCAPFMNITVQIESMTMRQLDGNE